MVVGFALNFFLSFFVVTSKSPTGRGQKRHWSRSPRRPGYEAQEIMIKNHRQYLIAVKKLRRLAVIRARISMRPSGPLNIRSRDEDLATVDKLAVQLESEITEYDTLVKTTMHIPELALVDQLASQMMRARIALGWSQKRLAEKSGMRREQIWRYEGNDYRNATLETVMKVSAALASGLAEKKDGLNQLQAWLKSRRGNQPDRTNSAYTSPSRQLNSSDSTDQHGDVASSKLSFKS